MTETLDSLMATVDGLFGPLKAASEREAVRQFGERTTIVRPGYIVGPRDETDCRPAACGALSNPEVQLLHYVTLILEFCAMTMVRGVAAAGWMVLLAWMLAWPGPADAAGRAGGHAMPMADRCIGVNACQGLDVANVAAGACIGDYSCSLASGPVGENACIGYRTCSDAGVPIPAGSCHGREACLHRTGSTGTGSCIGDYACYAMSEPVGAGSCIGDSACFNDEREIVSVGDAACTGDAACAGGVGPFGTLSCNGNQTCTNTLGAVGEDSCNGDFACASSVGNTGYGSCNKDSACDSADGDIGNLSCNTLTDQCRSGASFPVGDCMRNDVRPAECPSPEVHADGFEQL